MPITELTSDSTRQQCASCSAEQEILLARLAAGTNRDGVIDLYIIALPTCPGCGAREFLIRTPDPAELARARPGSYSHVHRLLVDRLHHRLVDQDRIVQGADRRTMATLERTDRELETWLPAGSRLPVPPR